MHQAKLYPDFDPKTQIMIMAAAYGLGVGVTGGGGSGGDVVVMWWRGGSRRESQD